MSYNTSIAIVSRQLNGFNYCELSLKIRVNINYFFTDSEAVTSIAILFNITHSFTPR